MNISNNDVNKHNILKSSLFTTTWEDMLFYFYIYTLIYKTI